MRSSRVLTVTAVAAVFALSGCASGPTVDLDEAKAWVDDVVAAESDGPGSPAAGMLQVSDGDAAALEWDFEQPTTLTRLDVRCFGDDVTATVTAAVTLERGDVSTAGGEVPCDREPHDIVLDAADATALEFEATATTTTYVHVTAIQELVIERE